MSVISWSNSLLIGIKQIDLHHKTLIELINKVYFSLVSNVSDEKITEIINELLDYTIYHFNTEEYLMESNGYPNLLQHKKEHEEFCTKLYTLRAAFLTKSQRPEKELIVFLKDWLYNHIRVSDVDYSIFIKSLH